jgi:hypothetical protein
MRPLLKRVHSPDVFDLDVYSPEEESCFGFLLQAMFGPEEGEGEESFDMMVCTPEWLTRELTRKKIITGRHHLIVEEYDLQAIRSFLSAFGRKCEGNTWKDVALKLSRIGKWEFEDYTP